MTNRPPDLADYDRPPVVEVVLGVQFSELRAFRTVHVGLIWDRCFRASFPDFAEHPPLEPSFETFGQRAQDRMQIKLVQLPGPPLPRLWFLNSDKTELVQIQPDRFIHNWRRFGGRGTYPRYEQLRKKFFDELEDLRHFFADESLGEIGPNQCEISYVNHISLRGGDRDLRPEEIFSCWRGIDYTSLTEFETLPRFEAGRFALRFVVTDNDGNPVGRLYASAEPAQGPNQEPLINLTLTVKGAPIDASMTGVQQFLDTGRSAIVKAFTALTTPAMHELWGRTK